MRAFIVETVVWPIFIYFRMNVFFSLKGSKLLVLMILKYASLQNILCCSFHSPGEGGACWSTVYRCVKNKGPQNLP